MGTWIRRAVAVGFWISLLVSLLAWGGLVLDPEVGPTALQAISREGWLAAIYAHAGSGLAELAGIGDFAVEFARGRFGGAYDEMQRNPAAAMDILTRGMSALASACHWGVPVLGVAWAILWWRRPRGFHTFSPKR